MNKTEHEQNLERARTIKEAANDMHTVADVLREDLPPGQLKNLRGKSERLTTVLARWGVEL